MTGFRHKLSERITRFRRRSRSDGSRSRSVSSAPAKPSSDQSKSRLTLVTSANALDTSQNVWSAAFQEAIDSIETDIDVAILKGKKVEELFQDLQKLEVDTTQESAFVQGMKYLRKVKGPLENFKLALDVSAPLTALEPTTTLVFGVIRSVTAVSAQH